MKNRAATYFKNSSLRDKLTAVIMAVSAFALMLSYTAFMVYDGAEMKKSRILYLQTLAEMIGYHTTAALTFDDESDAAETLGSLAAEKNLAQAWIFDQSGRLFAEYQSKTPGLEKQFIARARIDTAFVDFRDQNIIIAQPILLNGMLVGAVRLRSTMDDLNARRTQYLIFGLGFTLLALLAAGTIASKLQRLISQPIVRLAEVAKRVKETRDYSVRAAAEGNDEVGVLVAGFNEMLSEIEKRDAELQHAHDQLGDHAEQLSVELTERWKAERQAEQMRSFLHNVIDAMPSALVVVDSDMRVIQWNHEAERITGVRREFADGQLLETVFPRLIEKRGLIEIAIKSHVRHDRDRISFATEDGERFYDLIIYPLYTVGIDGVVIRLDDCTDRVRMEEMMIQTEKMMSVGGLAAGMAHEINNPLGIIVQSAQNLSRRVSPDLPKNVEAAEQAGTTMPAIGSYFESRGLYDFIKEITDAGKRAAAIVSNMLNFSRKTESNMQPADIGELVRRSVELAASDYDLKKRYDFRHIKVVYDFDDSMGKIRCIETKIEQVLLNLLKNAAQAMGEHGTKDPSITCRTKIDGDWATIEIEDNGPGMPDVVRKRVFEPFFTTKEVGTGTGLGLSVSYFIVKDNHRGQMDVESHVGVGTKFTIRLPIDSNANETGRDSSAASQKAT